MEDRPRRSWLEAESERVPAEKEAMLSIAPDLTWNEGDPSGGWEGLAPVWPFDRPEPPELDQFLEGSRFKIRVEYLQAYPMVEPRIWPLDPEPDAIHRTDARWHVMGDGSLCLLQSASDWTGRESAADFVVKASGWFLEFQLMELRLIDAMTIDGLATDASRDHLFTLVARRETPKSNASESPNDE